MTVIDDINTCLSTYKTSVDQINCIRQVLGYPAIIPTSLLPCDGLRISGTCISGRALVILGASVILLYALSKN